MIVKCMGGLLGVLSTLGCLFTFQASPAGASPTVAESLLDNGLKVLIVEDHKAPLATFSIWYKVGARDEPSGKTGMSHLLEHMMFKGTERYGTKEFSNIIQRNGGMDNAYTTKDYTMYFQNVSSDRIGLSIALEADRMANLLLGPKEFSSEREVVLEERRMRYDDDPQSLLYEQLVATSLMASQYHWPVIGWPSDIRTVTREDLYRYYRSFYAPDNAFIVITGAVKAEDVLAMIRKEFGGIRRSEGRIDRPRTEEPEQKGERRLYLTKEAELPYVLVAYPVPNFPHEDSYALDVLSTMLADGKSSRLYRSLVVDKRIALNVFIDYSPLHRDPFLFVIGGTSVPGRKAEDVEAAIYQEIERIAKEPPLELEVQKAKNQIEASFVFAQDSNYSKASYVGTFEIIGGWQQMDKYLEGIRRVGHEDLQKVARRYLAAEHRTVAILIPLMRKGGSRE